MKKSDMAILVVCLLAMLLLSACGKTEPTPVETQVFETTIIPVEPTSLSEATPTPTDTPEPIPCTIAFDSDREGNRDVFSMAPDGSELINLTNDPGDDVEPSWSADGKRISFSSNRVTDSEGGMFIYVMNNDGSDVRKLNQENESKTPDWSPDDTWIVYESWGDIYKIKSDGSEASINLTNSPEKDTAPEWSPDGSRIAYMSEKDGHLNIFVMNPDGSDVKQLTSNGKAYDVTWTIDGQLFTHWEHPDGVCQKCVMNADGSDAKDAGGKGELQRYLPIWTLDGDRVECVSVNINGTDDEIYLVGTIYPDLFLNLTNNPANDRNPDWPANCMLNRTPSEAIQETSSPKEINIGYAGDDQWQPERKNNFQKACTELGINCVYGDITSLIAQGVSAIVQNSDSITVQGLHQDILNARDKGIPVILLDAESITDGAYSVTIDHDRWALTSLKWTLDKMGGKGQFAYFDLDPFNRYSKVISEVLNQYPDVTVVEKRDGIYDTFKIKPEFSDFMRQYPELKGIWTSYDNFQTMLGLEENGFTYDKWPVMVCDDSMDCLIKWQLIVKAYPGFESLAIGNPSGIAYDAVYVAYYLATGAEINEAALSGPYGKSLYVDLPIVGNDNLQEWIDIMNKNNYYHIDQLMTPEEIMEKWFKN